MILKMTSGIEKRYGRAVSWKVQDLTEIYIMRSASFSLHSSHLQQVVCGSATR